MHSHNLYNFLIKLILSTINRPPKGDVTTMIPYKQLSLADIFEDCQNIFEEDTLGSFLCLNNALTPVSIYRFLFTTIFMHQPGAPAHTL